MNKRYLKLKRVLGVSMIILSLLIMWMPKITRAENNNCGENVTWSINDSGTLTISGTGAMYDFNGTDTVVGWTPANVREVVIEEGVTSIGARAFADCSSLRSVSVPATLTSIGTYAFGGCDALSDVTYAGTETAWKSISIGSDRGGATSTSSGNGALSVVTYHWNDGTTSNYCGDNVKWTLDAEGNLNITGSGAMYDYISTFYNNSSIKNVVIGSGVTNISGNAFMGCSNLAGVTIPDTVRTIGSNAFSRDTSIKALTLPAGITDIASGAFDGCTGIVTISLPSGMSALRGNTFSGCSGVTSIDFPESITSVGASAFDGCSGLVLVRYAGSKSGWDAVTVDATGNTALVNATKTYAKADPVPEPNNNNSNNNQGNNSNNNSGNNSSNNSSNNSGNNSSNNSGNNSNNSSNNSNSSSENKTDSNNTKATINDQRGSKDNTAAIAATITPGVAKTFSLVIKDSTGEALKKLVKLENGVTMTAYDISLVDSEGKALTGFTSCQVTLPIPSTMDTTKGSVKAVTVKSDGTLEELTTSVVDSNSAKCAQFSTTHFSEYGLVYTPKDGASKVTVNDQRSNKENTAAISATVTPDPTKALTLVIKDSNGDALKKLVKLSTGATMVNYDISLLDSENKAATGFTSCQIKLPIPSTMDTTKGSVKVVTIKSDNTLEELSTTVVDVSGTKCAQFTTSHFSEYGIVYTPNSSNGGSSSGGSNNANDMPRTGDEGVIRMLSAVLVFLFGCIIIVTSIPVKKRA